MKNEKIKGNYKQLKGKIKKKWGRLSDDEIESTKGNWELLEGKIIERYGMLKEKAKEAINEFLKSLNKKSDD